MDGVTLLIFLATVFFGAIVSGLAGFAMGLVVSGVWLHILTPAQTAAMIVLYGLVVQTYSLWRLRKVLKWRAVAPFILGGAVGIPAGAALLSHINPDYVRIGVGVLLVVYSTYSLARPHFKPMHASFAVETGVGVVNGLLGGMTGLAGPIITIWCQLRGWRKDEQRAVFQPVILAAFVMTAMSLGYTGVITRELLTTYIYGLPVLIAGLWLGLHLYGRLDEVAFRKVILVLLLLSGIVLIVPWSLFS
jgi:uncharacterized membrane protein YfcA